MEKQWVNFDNARIDVSIGCVQKIHNIVIVIGHIIMINTGDPKKMLCSS